MVFLCGERVDRDCNCVAVRSGVCLEGYQSRRFGRVQDIADCHEGDFAVDFINGSLLGCPFRLFFVSWLWPVVDCLWPFSFLLRFHPAVLGWEFDWFSWCGGWFLARLVGRAWFGALWLFWDGSCGS